jgi:GAF domain-containing protein
VLTFDGELIRLAALANVSPAGADEVRRRFPRLPGRGNAASRAVETRRVVAIPDVFEDPEYDVRAPLVAEGFRSVLAVPLMREKSPIGAITVVRPEPGRFPDKQIALLQTFADQAVIAIENVRLFTELEARTTELTQSVGELKALGDVGQAVSSTLDLETVLSTIVARATELAGLDGGSIWEYDDAREEFRLHATNGLPDELVGALRSTPIRKGQGALGRLAVTRVPVAISDIARERTYPGWLREIVVRCGYRSVLAVPLLREDQLMGALAVNRSTAGEFGPAVIELMRTFASQSALAIQNARLFREIEDKSRQLEWRRHKRASSANMSHELRTPLNAIIAFEVVRADVRHDQWLGRPNTCRTSESGRHLLSSSTTSSSLQDRGRPMELEPSDSICRNDRECVGSASGEPARNHACAHTTSAWGRSADERGEAGVSSTC